MKCILDVSTYKEVRALWVFSFRTCA